MSEETFDFESWLATGTVNEETVRIILDQQAAAECERLIALIEAETDSPGHHDAPLGGRSRLEELEAQYEAAYERFKLGSVEITVRASSQDDEEAAFEAVPALIMPPRPLDRAGSAAFKKWQEQMAKHLEKTKVADEQRQVWLTARCVVRVVRGDGSVLNHMTAEQVEALKSRPGGQTHYQVLTDAVNRATAGRSDVERPKSLEPSTSDLS